MAKPKFRRRIFLIKRGLQFRYMFSVMLIMLLSSLIVGWTIYYSIWDKVSKTDSNTFQFENLNSVWDQVNMSLLMMVPVLIILVCVFSLMLSHKIAGPVYRFEESAKQIANGDLSLRIKLRTGDELMELSDLFNKMTGNLESLVEKDREIIDKIIGIINQIPMSLKQDELSDEEKEEIIYELTDVVSSLKEVTYSFKTTSEKKDREPAKKDENIEIPS